MPVAVKCPGCNQPLNAPKEMIGQLVSCPSCSTQFPITQRSGNRGAAAPDPNGPPPPLEPPLSPTGTKGASRKARFKNPAAATPPAAPPATPPPVRPGAPPTATPGTPTTDAPPIASPTPPPVAPPVDARTGKPADTGSLEHVSMGAAAGAPPEPPPEPPPAYPKSPPKETKPRRKPKQAKFVTADATETKIELGADGQLPELALQETRKAEPKESQSKSSGTLVLVGVLLLSFGLSIAMLFVNPTSQQSEAKSKSRARAHIRQHYIGMEEPFEPYQKLLREALNANQQEDYDRERRLYRRVLDMLRSEDKNEGSRLTGVLVADTPPYDKDLEEKLRTLLSQD